MFKRSNLKVSKIALALALVGCMAGAHAVSVYTTQTRVLNMPSVNVPGHGSVRAQLALRGDDPPARGGHLASGSARCHERPG